jgi:hypothetical protein
MRMAGFITRYLLKSGSTIFVPFGFKRPDPPLSNRRVGTCGRLPYAPPRPQVRYSYRPESTVARATIAYCRL